MESKNLSEQPVGDLSRDLGQVMTPMYIATQLTELIENKEGSIIDPSCGEGVFLNILPNCIGIEIDPKVITHKDRVIHGDFFKTETLLVDTFIGNPPYVKKKEGRYIEGILTKSANLYLHFIYECYKRLREGGELIFIVPFDFLYCTRGNKVRELMIKDGSFTHFFTDLIEWDNANVDTIIFRYQKGLKTNDVFFNNEKRTLVFSKSKIFFCQGEYFFLKDEGFTGGVGSVGKKSLETEKGIDIYTFEGKKRTYTDDTSRWPRWVGKKVGEKILVNVGPTRKRPFFKVSDESMFNCGYIQCKNVHLEEWSNTLNSIPDKVWEELGMMRHGRWITSIVNLLNCPLPLKYKLSNIVK